MERFKRYALLSSIIERLNEKGFCGETHIQKAVYFLQKLFPPFTGYPFILYKYGPFSFALRDDLGIMEALEIIRVFPQSPSGTRIVTGDMAERIKAMFQKVLKETENKIDFVTEKLGGKSVKELEILATALYIKEKLPGKNLRDRAGLICALKPHISFKEALSALEKIGEIEKESKKVV